MGNKNCRLHTQDRDKTPENLSVSCLPAASFYFIVRRQTVVSFGVVSSRENGTEWTSITHKLQSAASSTVTIHITTGCTARAVAAQLLLVAS